MKDELPDPVVSSDEYTEDYYRNRCAGFAEWSASEGAVVWNGYKAILDLAKLTPGEIVLDVGTGRGELPAIAVERGASRAIGIEYAHAALGLAQQTFAAHGVADRATVVLADSRALPLRNGVGDLVTMVDVVEHLARDELERTLGEARRVLRPGGRIFVHTMPNRTIYNVTYRLQRLARKGRRQTWPRDPRLHDLEHVMHVNEQSATSLKRYLRRAGFEQTRVWLGNWIYADFVPEERARLLYRRLATHTITKRFGAADLFGIGINP